MGEWQHNSQCIADYLELFWLLANDPPNAQACAERWRALREREQNAPENLVLAPRLLQERFGLGQRDLLLTMAALALEVDGGLRGAFRARYGLALPTVEYGMQLIEPICPIGVETLAELTGRSVLTGLLLTTAEATAYPLERPLILCRAAVAFLTGLSLPDLRGLTVYPPGGEEAFLPLHEPARARLARWYHAGGRKPLCIHGETGCGRRTLVRRACGGAVCLDGAELAGLSAPDRDHLSREAAVLAILLDVPLCLLCAGAPPRELTDLCRRFAAPLVLLTDTEEALAGAAEVIRLPARLTAGERGEVWQAFLPAARPDSVPAGGMSVGAVRETADLALRSAKAAGRDAVCAEDSRRALRQRGGALAFGIRYTPQAALSDMVLPPEVEKQLRLICAAARCGPQLAAWGGIFRREGVTAVFHGPSGTGKTMAAGAIARELGMPLLQADLSQIMDKYVGETEKHLGRLLRSARENRCVLLFDEADSLFGKRAAVSDGHDKYANLSTAFLLQEIEQYDGVALLSTNLLSSFDDAFLRRLQYIVRFTLPDAALREQLWRRALSEERREGEIPFSVLARAELSPARINSAARAAAVAALEEGKTRIDTRIVAEALRRELEKNGKTFPPELRALLSGAG